jgi:hypothetical protein
MSGDVPNAIAENDKELDALMDMLEKGENPALEAEATQKVNEVTPPVATGIETPPVVDDSIPPTPKLNDELEKADHRYKTLEGMMRANARRQAEIIEGLTEKLEAQRVAQVETPLDVNSILSEDELAQFGESGIGVLEKLARAITTREIEKASIGVEQKLEDMRRRVETAEASAEGTGTWDHVEAINPGAKAINASDSGWFTFLTTIDPISGREYRELGEAAAGVSDYQRLSMLIDTYRTSANLAKPAPSAKPPQTRTTPPNDGNRRTTKADDIVYTQDEIRDFFMARALGKSYSFRGDSLNVKQMDKLESAIDTAMEEGRILI